jgi:hypothetical protein
MQVGRFSAVGSTLLLSLMVAGCVTVGAAPAVQTREALALGNVGDKALVYFMAPQIGGTIVNVVVNGRVVGKVKDRTFIFCHFDPGSYDVTPDGQFPSVTGSTVKMAFEANKTYFVLTPYQQVKFSDPASSRRVLSEYYSLSKSSNCS